MPKATYDADFSTFRREVESAIVTLKGFEGEAENVAKELTDLTYSFAGNAVIQQATLMAKAVENVGGVAKLTARELEQVGNVAAQAAFKLQSWGQEVPDNLQKLAQYANPAAAGLRGVSEEASGLSATMLALGTALGDAAQIGAQKIAGLVTDTLRQAQALRSLGNETGIAVEELQVLGEMFRESGVSTEQMGKAIDALQRRIQGDKGSAAAAFHELGVTMEEMRSKTPLETFRTTIDLLDKMENRSRAAALAGDLIGERLGVAVLKVAHNFEEAHKQAAAFTSVMTTEQVEKVAKMADAWEKIKTSVTVQTADAILQVAGATQDMNDAFERGVPVWKVLGAFFLDSVLKDALRADANVLHDIAAAARLAGVEVPRMMASHGMAMVPSHGGPGAGGGGPDAALMAILVDAGYRQKTDTQITTANLEERLAILYDLNLLTQENARAVGATVGEMQKYKREQDEIIQRQVTLSNALREYSNIQNEVTKRAVRLTDELNTQEERRLGAHTNLVGVMTIENKLMLEQLQQRALGPGATDTDPVIAAVTKRNERLRDLERQQEEFEADKARRNEAARSQSAFYAFFGKDRPPNIDRTQLDQSVQQAKIWADFDDDLKKIQQSADGVAGKFDKIGEAAERAAKKIRGMTDEADPVRPGRIPGTNPAGIGLAPTITPSRIQPGLSWADLGGKTPVTINVNGLLDPRTIRELSKAVGDEMVRSSGRQFGNR